RSGAGRDTPSRGDKPSVAWIDPVIAPTLSTFVGGARGRGWRAYRRIDSDGPALAHQHWSINWRSSARRLDAVSGPRCKPTPDASGKVVCSWARCVASHPAGVRDCGSVIAATRDRHLPAPGMAPGSMPPRDGACRPTQLKSIKSVMPRATEAGSFALD